MLYRKKKLWKDNAVRMIDDSTQIHIHGQGTKIILGVKPESIQATMTITPTMASLCSLDHQCFFPNMLSLLGNKYIYISVSRKRFKWSSRRPIWPPSPIQFNSIQFNSIQFLSIALALALASRRHSSIHIRLSRQGSRIERPPSPAFYRRQQSINQPSNE